MSERITKTHLKQELKFLNELTGHNFTAEKSPVGNWWTLYRKNEDTSLTRVSFPDPQRRGLPDFVMRLRGFRAGLVYMKYDVKD